MKRKALTFLLLTALLTETFGVLSCGSSTDTPAGDTTASAGTTAPEETSPFVPDNLPALDYGGKEVKVFIGDYNDAYVVDMVAEEETGSRLNDAIYHSIQSVEERLNVDLVYSWESYTWAESDGFISKVASWVMAGDDTMDLHFSPNNYTAQMLEGDYFIDLSKEKYIDLEKPWYNQTVKANMPTDYIHFVSGSFAIANVKNAYAIYYNDDLYKSLGRTEDLYELVDSGKWTKDKFTELLKDTYADLNGDTKADYNDRYGLTFGDENKYMGFMKSFGMDIFVKTKDGYEFAYDNARALDAIEFLCKLVNENEAVLKALGNSDHPECMISTGGGNYASKLFVEGNSLFSCSLVADASTIVPAISFSYGLLPYPKWDESMDGYHTMLQRNCYAVIPVTSKDTECAGAVLEAMSSECYRSLLPEYCEVSLKVRYSQDDNVSRMFDLICGSIVYDPGEIFARQLGTPSATVKTAISQNDPNWASRMASAKAGLVEKMDAILK